MNIYIYIYRYMNIYDYKKINEYIYIYTLYKYMETQALGFLRVRLGPRYSQRPQGGSLASFKE